MKGENIFPSLIAACLIISVGDAVEITDYITGFNTMTPLAGPANKQGRIAADNVMG